MKVRFLVTPVGLMMGNVESARRLKEALSREGVEVTTECAPEDCDILHVHTPIPPRNMGIVRSAKAHGIPVVMHAHTTAEDSVGTWTGSGLLENVTGVYLTGFYNMGDLVLAPSAWTRGRLAARGVKVPIRVLSNGVDLDRFRLDPERRRRFRDRYGIPEDALVAYSVGVICLKKGIETFPEVTRAIPSMRFIWVGRRSRVYHPLKVSSAIKRCDGNARFLNDVEDIVDAHCGGDIFFSPSFTENQGMAVMEALSVGRPVVARDLPSYRGLLDNGRSAIVGKDSTEFVSGLEALRKDERLAARLVKGGQEAVAPHDIRLVAKELKAIYGELLDGSVKGVGVGE